MEIRPHEEKMSQTQCLQKDEFQLGNGAGGREVDRGQIKLMHKILKVNSLKPTA